MKYGFIERLVPVDRLQLEPDDPRFPPRKRFFSELRSDGARCSDHHFVWAESQQAHFFGIHLASNGYAYTDELDAFTTNLPPLAIANFNDYCRPELERLGMWREPRVRTFFQVW